jgi:hypothetical protein
MSTPTRRRLFVVLLSLALAALGCARANSPIFPVTPDYATRQPPTATITPIPPTPTATVPSPTPEPATATPETPPTSVPEGEYPAQATSEPTAGAPTETSADTPVPATEAPAQALPSETPPPPPPADTAPPPTIAPQTIQPMAIPAGATFTQQMVVTSQGGEMIGDPGYLIDGRTVTWAALDGGHTAWVFDLGSVRKIGGVKVYAQQPRGSEPTTLLAVEVSNDGQNWQPVLTGTGNCGEPNCDQIPQMNFTEIGFNPVSARYLRLRSGPNRFGFAEVALAIAP